MHKPSNERDFKTWTLSVLISLVVELPFVLLFFSGHPYPAFWFFLPSLSFWLLFLPSRWSLYVAALASQTVLLSIPVFWILTRRRRSLAATALQVLSFVIFLAVSGVALNRFELQRQERRIAIAGASHNGAARSLDWLNKSLALYKTKYGEYPASLERLAAPAQGPVNSSHAGLVEFPLPMEDYFTFTYTGRQSADGRYLAYWIHVDARPGKWSELYHFCSDETGVIHFDTTRDRCRRGPAISVPPPFR